MAALVEDEEIQRKGIVVVLYDYKVAGGMRRCNLLDSFMAFGKSVPIAIQAYHFCTTGSHSVIKPVLQMLQFAVGRHGRVRFRCHFGKKELCFFVRFLLIPANEPHIRNS